MSEDSGRKYVIPDDPADRLVRTRRAVRVIMVGPDDTVLLFEDSDPGIPGVTWWVTPGGGMDPGETERQTAVRELAEETGYRVAEDDLVGPLATRFAVHGYSDQILEQQESFYLVRVPAFEIDTSDHTDEEQITLQSHRWWTRAEIAAGLRDGAAWIWPAQLIELWDRAGVPGRAPLELGRIEDESTVPVGGTTA